MVSELDPAVRALVGRYRALLANRFEARLERVVVFGSRARGDAEPDSDLDVAIVIASLSDAERGDAIDLAFQAWREAGEQGPLIAPLVWSSAEHADRRAAERRIALDIEREGISV